MDYPWLEKLVDDEVNLAGKTFAEAAALAGVAADEDWLKEWGHLKVDPEKRGDQHYEDEDYEDDDD